MSAEATPSAAPAAPVSADMSLRPLIVKLDRLIAESQVFRAQRKALEIPRHSSPAAEEIARHAREGSHHWRR